MEKIMYEFNGYIMECNLAKNNLRKMVSDWKQIPEELVTDGLVQYDKATNIVTVDENASDSYAKYAAIHECVCCGKYGYLAPVTDDPDSRCGLIDKMLIESMPKAERESYTLKRIEMFQNLLKFDLNPDCNQQFEKSISILSQLI